MKTAFVLGEAAKFCNFENEELFCQASCKIDEGKIKSREQSFRNELTDS